MGRVSLQNTILLSTLLENQSLKEKQRYYLERVKKSSDNLLHIINDILDLSKIESAGVQLEICECSPYQLVNEVIAVLQVKADAYSVILISFTVYS